MSHSLVLDGHLWTVEWETRRDTRLTARGWLVRRPDNALGGIIEWHTWKLETYHSRLPTLKAVWPGDMVEEGGGPCQYSSGGRTGEAGLGVPSRVPYIQQPFCHSKDWLHHEALVGLDGYLHFLDDSRVAREKAWKCSWWNHRMTYMGKFIWQHLIIMQNETSGRYVRASTVADCNLVRIPRVNIK